MKFGASALSRADHGACCWPAASCVSADIRFFQRTENLFYGRRSDMLSTGTVRAKIRRGTDTGEGRI